MKTRITSDVNPLSEKTLNIQCAIMFITPIFNNIKSNLYYYDARLLKDSYKLASYLYGDDYWKVK